jgi:dihydroneopterin aldolase
MNTVFYAHHGVEKAEHKLGARYEVDAEIKVDFFHAAEDDNINETIDYGRIYKNIQETLMTKKYYLIEAVAKKIADDLVVAFPTIIAVRIKVRKKNPPVGGVCDYAEADYLLEAE